MKRLLAMPSCEVLELDSGDLVPMVRDAISASTSTARRIDVTGVPAVQLDVVTLFPEWFDWFADQRHVRNAIAAGHELRTLNPRDHTTLSGRQVDDTPFGGGAGMVLRVDVMDRRSAASTAPTRSSCAGSGASSRSRPGGRVLDDRWVDELAAEEAVTFLCGRYEGFDERIVQHFCSDALSVGRYVLSGGELAAMVACRRDPAQAAGRARPRGVASRSRSPRRSRATRSTRTTRGPAEYRGWKVPDVLLSGHHAEIGNWRRLRSRERGGLRRPPPRPVRYLVHRSWRRSSILSSARNCAASPLPAGDRVRVHFQVIEGTRRRTQVFEGVVIKRQGHGARETFTVRKQSFGVGVERTFPVHSPKIEKIEVAARGDVRRAKLYYLRERVGKRARVRERRYIGPEEAIEPGRCNDPVAQLEAEAAAEPEARRRRRRRAPRTPPPTRRSTRPRPRRLDHDATEGGDEAPAKRPRSEASAEAPDAEAAAEAAEGDAADDEGRVHRSRSPRGTRSSSSSSSSPSRSGLALGIQAFLVKPYRIPSESMVPTLEVNQRVLVNRIGKTSAIPRSATSWSSTRRSAPSAAARSARSRCPRRSCAPSRWARRPT